MRKPSGRPQDAGVRTDFDILIVDDDEDVRTTMRALLGRRWRVAAADSGAEALSLLANHRPWVMLLDLDMPGMSGFEVLASPEVRGSSMRKVVVTGCGDFAAVDKAFALGIREFITKPVDIDALRGKLERMIPDRTAEAAPR